MPRGWTAPSLEMRRISCLLRLSLLPEMVLAKPSPQRCPGRCLRTRFGEHRRSVTSNDANQLVARHFNNGSHCVSDMKIRALCPISGSNDSRKRHEMRSFPNLALSILLALMNVSVTFNAHLSLSDTFAIVSPSFLFFTPFCSVPHCLVLYFAI